MKRKSLIQKEHRRSVIKAQQQAKARLNRPLQAMNTGELVRHRRYSSATDEAVLTELRKRGVCQ